MKNSTKTLTEEVQYSVKFLNSNKYCLKNKKLYALFAYTKKIIQ